MKVKCKFNSGNELSEKTLSSIHDSPLLHFPLKVGDVYTVYSTGVINNVPHYLVIPDRAGLPSWFPAELFTEMDGLLPVETYFRFIDNDEIGYSVICGYRELVLDDHHRNDLLEREEHAIKVFLKRKQEIDELYS